MVNVVALVLAGGKMGDYGVLTQNRAKGALTVAGHLRIIDFALSNLVNSGINQIGLIIQYLPGSLIEHVGSGHPWDLDNYGKALKIMPPFVGVAETVWYNGTADAIYQNLNFVRDQKAEHVVVLSGEHVFYCDFRDILAQHIAKDSDLTVITKELPDTECKRRYGYVESADNGRILRYVEKPETPPNNIAATGIYVFKASTLQELLSRGRTEQERHLALDILQENAHKINAYEYRMRDCWDYMETVRDYFALHQRLINDNILDKIRQWNIRTNLKFRRVGHAPAAMFGKQSLVERSLISPACEINGTVKGSVLSPGVTVAAGATVTNCILMHDCVVGEGAVLDHVVSDRDATFGDQCVVGRLDGNPEGQDPDHPLTLIGKGSTIGTGIVIRPGAQVRPGQLLSTQDAANLEASL